MAFLPLTYLLDFSTSSFEKLELPDFTLQLLEEVSRLCDFQVVNRSYHKFEPQGLTAMLLLAESHISIHTWPEKQIFSIDIFTCKGPIDLAQIIICLQSQLSNLEVLQSRKVEREFQVKTSSTSINVNQ